MLDYVPVPARLIYPDLFPKYQTSAGVRVFEKLTAANGTLGRFVSRHPSEHFIFYQEATQYWTKATVGLPYYSKNSVTGAPAHGRYLYFHDRDHARSYSAILNSSLFYLYFVAFGDCFHLSDMLATGFPVPPAALQDSRLIKLSDELMESLQASATRKTISTRDGDTITYDEFRAGESKELLDKIDSVLGKHYGFTSEEIDLITSFDSKFRLGQENEEIQ
jgi:hypothetical protein